MKLRHLAFPMVLLLAACAGSSDDEDIPGVATADDSMTSEEMQMPTVSGDDMETSAIETVDSDTAFDADGVPIPSFDDIDQLEAHHQCHRVTGYRYGNPFKLCVVRVNGKLVQRGTARVYLKMRHAAAQDGVSLYIVSGFRTMKEQRH